MIRKTAAYYFHRLRKIIVLKLTEDVTKFLSGGIEVNESYFGGTRKGNRGRGAAGKVPVFDLLKPGGKIYTKIIPDTKASTLMPIIQEKVIPDSIVYSDHWRGYNCWMYPNSNIIGLIIQNCLRISLTTLME